MAKFNVVHLSFDSPGEQYSFGISLFPAGEGSCSVLETLLLDRGNIPTGFVRVLVSGIPLKTKVFLFCAILFHFDIRFIV